jgi:hypothetical protein
MRLDASLPKSRASVNFSYAVFSLLIIHADVVIWDFLHMVRFRGIQFGAVLFGASYVNLK